MKTETSYKIGLDMIYLAACALQNKIPEDEVMKNMDFNSVYSLAKNQSMVAVTFYGLEMWPKAKTIVEQELLNKWQEKRDKSIRNNMLFDIERERILSFLETTGIWYMPLKGIIIKELYPQIGMRQMADNDILFDSNYRVKVYEYMIGQGYQSKNGPVIEFEKEVSFIIDDAYHKKPIYNFEMHMALFRRTVDSRWLSYYEKVKNRLIKDDCNNYGFHFTDEDFYVYMIAHSGKHFNGSGHGFRNLMDVYVYLDRKKNLDWEYIYIQLEKLGLSEYENDIRSFAKKLFGQNYIELTKSKKKLSEKEQEIFKICLFCNTYGKQQHLLLNRMKKISENKNLTVKVRIRYLLNRLIPEQEVLLYRYPKLAKKKFFQPLCILMRIGEGIVHKPKKLWKEFINVWKCKPQ